MGKIMKSISKLSSPLVHCPFCGCNDNFAISSNGLEFYFVLCGFCGAEGPVGNIEEEALTLWNNRAVKSIL